MVKIIIEEDGDKRRVLNYKEYVLFGTYDKDKVDINSNVVDPMRQSLIVYPFVEYLNELAEDLYK